jgi:uncharacterized membrane protein YfcA
MVDRTPVSRYASPVHRFLAVSGLFVAINLVAALVFWTLGQITLLVIPDAGERLWPYLLCGLLAIAAAILGAKWGLTLTARLRSRDPARGRG